MHSISDSVPGESVSPNTITMSYDGAERVRELAIWLQ